MARKVDNFKLERIKNATMKTIVDYGIEGTTTAMIAKNANVSGGYLYRLYSGKQDLIESLYSEKVNSLNNEFKLLIEANNTSIIPIIKAFVEQRVEFAQKEPIASKFFYLLIHNNNLKTPETLKNETILLIENLKEIGVKANEINPSLNVSQIYYHIIIYVVDYIQFKKENYFNNDTTTIISDTEYLITTILTILKK